MNSRVKKKTGKFKYTNKGTYAVVKFYEANKTKLFDCIPDLWFANEEKTICFWPPSKSKKSVTLLAMNQDLPGDDWETHECEVISEGHATYSIAINIVREKTTQNYNTSSADEHMLEAKFRREHPGLIHNGEKSFENVFARAKVAQIEKDQSIASGQKTQETGNKDAETYNKKCVQAGSNSESCKRRSRSQSSHSHRKDIDEQRNNRFEEKTDNLQPGCDRSQSRNMRAHLTLRSESPENDYVSRSRSRTRTPSNHSMTRVNRFSRSQSIRSRSRSADKKSPSRSRSRSNHSKSRGNRSSRSQSITYRSSQSVEKKSPSRSRSSSSHSKSRRSNRLEEKTDNLQPRCDRSQSRNMRAHLTLRSESPANDYVSRSRSRTRTPSNHSMTRVNRFSRSQSIRSRSRSADKKSPSRSRSRSNHSKSRGNRSSRSQSITYRSSQSVRKKWSSGDRYHLNSHIPTRNTNHDNSTASYNAASAQARNHSRVEEMYRALQLRRAANNSTNNRSATRKSPYERNRSGSRNRNYDSKSVSFPTRCNISPRNGLSESIVSHRSPLRRDKSPSGNRQRSKSFTNKSVPNAYRENTTNLNQKTDNRSQAINRSTVPNRSTPLNRSSTAPNRSSTAPNRSSTAPNRSSTAPNRSSTAPNRSLTAPNRSSTAANRSTVVVVSSPDLSPRRIDADRYKNHECDSVNFSETTGNDSSLLQTLLQEVRELKRTVTKNERRFIESDRRLTRLEVTTNKTFIVLGDVSNAINVRMSLGNNMLPTEDRPPKGFYEPELPIERLKELVMVNKDLKNKNFLNYLVNREKEFCCWSNNTTDTSTMTAYLRRFIHVDLRASIVLKDLKGQQGMTLYNDFHNVYLFLVDTMKYGYRIKNKIITNKEVHVVLRTVWGRSKQTAEEANKRR